MSALKPLDFQEATANRILELYQQKQYRVLLADEVGLGKTIIASAVIQKVADLHAAWDDHFKLQYQHRKSELQEAGHTGRGLP